MPKRDTRNILPRSATRRKCIIDGCSEYRRSHGYCEFHFGRWKRTGDPLGEVRAKAPSGAGIEFIKQSIAESTADECIVWPFCKSKRQGYGVARHKGKNIPAHRLALILATGGDQPDLLAAHGPCNNRACINTHPDHGLSWKTSAENAQDTFRDGTARVGEKSYRAKLTEDQVMKIRLDARAHRLIARDYDISSSHVCSIKRRACWKHIA